MKKLKASEITEEGPYWLYFGGPLNDEAPLLISRKGGKDLYVRYFGSPLSHKLNTDLTSDSLFIKAEPPKTCRYTMYDSSDKNNVAKAECIGKLAVTFFKMWNFCPNCGGHIEIQESTGD